MRTGAEAGLPPTPESIRTGEVAMEHHPNYPALVRHLVERGYPLVVLQPPKPPQELSPYVVFKRICNKQGDILREEKHVAVVAGMRYIDLEHEAGHVAQLEDIFGGNLPTEKWVQLTPIREVHIDNAPDVLKPWHDAVTEYHNRLVEYIRLAQRGVSPELLNKHLDGLQKTQQAYNKEMIWERASGKARQMWTKQYFPDLDILKTQVPSHK